MVFPRQFWSLATAVLLYYMGFNQAVDIKHFVFCEVCEKEKVKLLAAGIAKVPHED